MILIARALARVGGDEGARAEAAVVPVHRDDAAAAAAPELRHKGTLIDWGRPVGVKRECVSEARWGDQAAEGQADEPESEAKQNDGT